MMPLISSATPASEEKCCSADLLNRQGFVQRMISVAETLSANKRSACYAINGEWGVGKTFVLKEFEKQSSVIGQEESLLNKYLVFHYNCWEYDYYEEPLIALVAVILEQIDAQVKLIPDDKREKIKAALKIVGNSIWRKAKGVIEDKTGVSVEEISQLLSGVNADAKAQIEASHKFDAYFEFKKILKELSKVIAELAKEQTILLVVDELDRCLPEYAIKVLERLHHVFEDVPNVQIILAVDKQQLENTVKQIYGNKTSVEHYLEKFIQFEIKLDVADSQKIIEQTYPKYLQRFPTEYTTIDEVNEICQILLCGIDIRRSKVIIEKSYLCHGMLTSDDETPDRAMICVEIFLTLLKTYGLNVETAKSCFTIDEVFPDKYTLTNGVNAFTTDISTLTGLKKLAEIFRSNRDGRLYFNHDQHGRAYIDTTNAFGLLLATYRVVLGFEDDYWEGSTPQGQIFGEKYPKRWISEYIQKYWDFLQIIN